ncbi:MAG: hypothetical protein K9N46_05430 [Candidatus Marinimicrobia bacterium]|nr:hypothetical protein [Candidatus Neomarinimicrobiota bacterium]MCF7880164.1 hypothetical protein [Candidatus Neomarinimicrobiota bacterium]
MTDDYKKEITNYVRDVIQQRIAHLKEAHPDRLYTNQWQLQWPDGFQEGNNVIPVTTTTKDGPYCIGELHLVVPPSFELDLEAMEFVPKNEPYQAPQPTSKNPPSLNNSLELMNAMFEALNGFLSTGLSSQEGIPTTGPQRTFSGRSGSPEPQTPGSLHTGSSKQLEQVRKAILRHDDLPDWFINLRDTEIRDQLLNKMADTYIKYSRQHNGNASLAEFFGDYTEYLKENDTLQDWCTYKAKPVELNRKGWCQETYCSKKPYRSTCPRSTLKFTSSQPD